MASNPRQIMLRSQDLAGNRRFLWASLDQVGNLHIDGQDLGPGTASVNSDGEYEWFQTINSADIPRLIELLGGSGEDDILSLLERAWSGDRSYELERRLRESEIPIQRTSRSG